jgi:hypothetical protein
LTSFYILSVGVEVCNCCTWSHSMTHTYIRQDSSGRLISPTQRPLPDNTQLSQERDTQQNSNSQSQQAIGSWPTP